MTRSGNGYLFRRSIPAPLRNFLDKREIKIPLGRDYVAACRQAREEAVRSDQTFDEVRAVLAQQEELAKKPFARYESLQPITELTDDLKGQLNSFWLSLVDQADLERRANGFADDDPEEFRSEAASMLALLKKAWRDADIEPFLPALHTTLMIRGYRLDLPLEDEKRLCLQFLRSALASYKLIADRDDGEDPPIPLTHPVLPTGTPIMNPTPKKSAKSDPNVITLTSLFEYWRDVPGRIPKTIDDVEQRIKAIDLLTGNKPADQLRKADFIAYRDQRLTAGKAPRTVQKDLSFLKAVLQYAFDSDKLPSNPAAGIKVPKAGLGSVEPFLDKNDLQSIFSSAIYFENLRPRAGCEEAAAWLPLLALYTGGRLEELCQLHLSDIKTENGIAYLRILDLPDEDDIEEGSSGTKPIKILKNEPSRRNIPIHQALIDAGFLTYVAHQRKANAVRLFPLLKPDAKYGRLGANWSKWWGRWRKKLNLNGRDKCFHAFRHVFKTAARAAKIEEQYSDALTGHAGGGTGRDYGRFPVDVLNQMIQLIHYPDLNFDWVWQPVGNAPTRIKAKQANAQISEASIPRDEADMTSTVSPTPNGTTIYYDTEFTNLSKNAEIISLGAVAVSGESFYAEITPQPDRCSDFVQQTVLPLLTGPKLTADELTAQFVKWLSQFEHPVLVSDSSWDILVVRRLIEVDAHNHPGNLILPGNVQPIAFLKINPRLRAPLHRLLEQTMSGHFELDSRQHHALVDAQALRAGMLAVERQRQENKS
jgi:integrase